MQSKPRIHNRETKSKTSRLSHLNELVTEFQDTEDKQAKLEILANLGNFAYDPFNYDAFVKLNIIELFVDMLEEKDEKLQEFAIGGICNCIPDKQIMNTIIEIEAVPLIASCLTSANKAIVLSAMTSLYYLLIDEKIIPTIIELQVDKYMNKYSTANDLQLKNTSTAFLSKFASLQEDLKKKEKETTDDN